ncbi:hypothetical protein D9758_016219 [Tetrapyrgos nigripes]|uniref:Helicase C-terminal domain-containing protein n=1 Tax=Tetrapyrgos nigripes TaxID=182062 RepID=A0A8H5CMX6_9AGAR|nr:hypothetical protein D9758_016219 [Tetrapyrgos nigripes]
MVLLFDQPWSSQDAKQIIGRAHRQPQDQVVDVIFLLGRGSSDMLVNEMAKRKHKMFKVFVNKKLDSELETILQGKPVGHPDQEIDDEDSKPPVRKVARKRRKGPAESDNTDFDTATDGGIKKFERRSHEKGKGKQ